MDIFFKSLIAAVVTAAILLIERYSGPRIAGAIGGIPIVFAITFVLITYQAKDVHQINEYLSGGIIGAIAAVLFSVVLIFLNSRFLEYYWLNFLFSYAFCFLFALVVSHYSRT